MKKRTKIATLLTTLALTASMAACGGSSSSDTTTAAAGTSAGSSGYFGAEAQTVYRTLDEIKESGTINIGVFSDKNPFGYVDENGEYQGYDVYFCQPDR